MKNLKVQELNYQEKKQTEGGFFPEGSFLDNYFMANSSSYRDFKAFLS
ncbi:hypothetical protein [Zobellia nedashkovskayae]|nr:hypothetical protein [Zobellia nedashkovskayae]